jgi:folate-binding protein YgfZ
MLKPVENPVRQTRLADMGVVRVQGADAIKFLQGQVSNDVARLSADRSVLAGLHNPQGRVIALLRLMLAAPDEVIALVPRELAASVAARLGKFVLRAKVRIGDVSAEWEVEGVVVAGGGDAAGAGIAEGPADASVGASVGGGVGASVGASGSNAVGASVGDARRDEGRLWVCVATSDGTSASSASRWLTARPLNTGHSAEPRSDEKSAALHVGVPIPSSMTRDEWRALDIAAGLPQIYTATSESFVAQMLNLDLIDAIAFDKGCYTGQEVIARAHYRGKVKRRMQRFRTLSAHKLAPGESGTLADGRSFKVVDAVQLADERCEFLAVTTFGADAEEGEPLTPSASSAASAVQAEQLPLPYPLPA